MRNVIVLFSMAIPTDQTEIANSTSLVAIGLDPIVKLRLTLSPCAVVKELSVQCHWLADTTFASTVQLGSDPAARSKCKNFGLAPSRASLENDLWCSTRENEGRAGKCQLESSFLCCVESRCIPHTLDAAEARKKGNASTSTVKYTKFG